MSLSVEDLMKPRYKVTSIYPFSPYKVGDIVEPENKYFLAIETSDRCLSLPISSIEIYPQFQWLHWWEERTIEEMPEYVKVTREDCVKDTGLYCKVYKWSVFDEKFPSVAGHFGAELEGYTPLYLARTELNFPGQIYGRLNAMNLQPATREEYEQYKQKEVQ